MWEILWRSLAFYPNNRLCTTKQPPKRVLLLFKSPHNQPGILTEGLGNSLERYPDCAAGTLLHAASHGLKLEIVAAVGGGSGIPPRA